MNLKNKKILVVSPQDWDHIKVSKHHYALELSKYGNEVYFLNPPSKTYEHFNFSAEKIDENLFVLRNSLFFPYKLKFHANWLFKKLLTYHVKRINKFLGHIDVVWSFSSYYTNLAEFNADLSIYHPVDRVKERDFITPSENADYLFGVTEDILSNFIQKKKHLINHGLSRVFILEDFRHYSYVKGDQINVCYCGNLNIATIDRKLIMSLIDKHPNIVFHFVGPYNESDPSASHFIKHLQSAKNAILHGKIDPNDMAQLYIKMDAFILCYDRLSKQAQDRNKSSNSHKILEYLSTGRVLISTNMSSYQNKKQLVEMLDTDSNEGYLAMFNKVIGGLKEYNGLEKRNARIKYARDNSYLNRIKEIEEIIA